MFVYNIDQVVFRNSQLFAYGWGFFSGSSVKKVQLLIHFADGSLDTVAVEYGQQRKDVKDAYVTISDAENCGFVLMAGLKQVKVAQTLLRWEFNNRQSIDTILNLPEEDSQHISTTPKPEKYDSKEYFPLKHYKILFIKAILLFRSAGLFALIRKTKFYLSKMPKPLNEPMWLNVKSRLTGKKLTIVIDHDLGGGANIYRNKDIKERCANGEIILLLGFHIASLQYFVEVHENSSVDRYSISSMDFILNLVQMGNVQQVIYNCAVSFRQPFDVIKLILNIKETTKANLLVLIHDYFLLCPSHFLIDNNHKFCGVPNIDKCNQCLPIHKDGFVSMSGIRDITRWRQEWSVLLTVADEVRMFSESSKTLLKKAYPLLDNKTWRVLPHTLHTEVPIIALEAGEYLHIGIVGTIGKHKGSLIVGELVNEIIRTRSSTKITIIGTLEAKVSNDIVTTTGAYQPEELSETIKNSGVNVLLFPSIWAETFSYVSHELVAMGVPFACFDFGAPADLARSYKHGLVLSSMSAENILNNLENFRSEIYQTN